MKREKMFAAGMLAAAVLLFCHGAATAGAPILNGVNPTLTPPTAIGDLNPPGYTVSSFLNPIVTDGTLLDDFEDGNNTSKWGGLWFTFNDAAGGGLSTVTPFPFTAPTAGGYNSAFCGKINLVINKGTLPYTPYVGVGINLKADLTVCDLTRATGFRYWYKGAKHYFKVETTDINLGVASNYQDSVPASATWKQAVFTWDSLHSVVYATGVVNPVPPTAKTVAKILSWVIQQTTYANGYTDSLFIDNVEVTGFADRGIAVTGADNANGAWQYSINAGTTWAPFGALSDASATLLYAAAKVRFVPNAAYTGPATFVFRAWNQTDNLANGATAKAAVPNGGVTAYSSVAATGTVQVQNTTLLPPTNLTYSQYPASYPTTIAITPNTPTSGGGAVASYSVAPALPLGLSLSPTTGVITGTPTTVTAQANYIVTATNAAGFTTFPLSITITSGIVKPSNLTYSANPATYGTTTAITPNTPSSGGGTVTSYSVAPALPLGLSLSPTTGVITGIPTAVTATANYVVTASNSAGSTTATLSITVMAAPANLTYLPNPASYPAGTAITPNTPTSTGGAVASYSVAPALPLGLSLSPTTGVITGIPSTVTATANYVVTATNAVGFATVPLSIAIVAAIVAPSNATVTPTPQSVVAGTLSVSFTVNVATGTPPYTYVWRKDLVNMVPAKTTQTITIAPVAASDAGSYTVVVTNPAGNTTSTPGMLSVTIPVKALFGVSATVAKAPATINFSDSSTGIISKRIWIFGDGSIDSSDTKTPQHQYNTPATYIATLVLMNGAVRADSAWVSIKIFKDNPIAITGRYSSPGKAEITYTTIPIPTAFPTPYADSVKLWYKSGSSIPPALAGTTLGRGYTVAAITGTQPFIDTVPVVLAGADTACGFMTQVHWYTGSWYWSDFNSGNGTVVVMKDTFPPVNNARVAGNYIYNTNSVVFVAYNMITGVDPATVDSFAIWFGTDTGQSTPDFTDPSQTRWFNLQAEMPTLTATNGRDSVIIANPLFNTGVSKKLWCALVLKGKNDKLSTTIIKAAYLAGTPRPVNPIKLHASAQGSSSKIILGWNPIGSGFSAIRFWYRTGAPVTVNTGSFTKPPFDSITLLSVTDTQLIVTGLSDSTRYFFGAQVLQGGQWSYVTDSSSANAITDTAGGKLTSGNSVHITSLDFDTATNQFVVHWTVTMLPESLEIGISYSTVGYPTIDTSVHQTVPVTANSGSVVVSLQEPLKFSSLTDTTRYYVALWERSITGKLTDPTPNSEAVKASPYYNWQNVLYFTKPPGDTNIVFNGNILLVTDGVTDQTVTRTAGVINLFQPDPPSLAGFIPVGIPFYFNQPTQSAPFILKIRCGTLPAGHTVDQVKIYRWEAGAWSVDRTTTFDSTGYVWIRTKFQDLYPFMALIDIEDVTLTRGTHVDTLPARTDVIDTLHISDNSGNVYWRYSYARGGDAYTPGTIRQDTLRGTGANIPIFISGYYVSAENGLRASVIVSDGVHNDTINVSRQVSRIDSSDFEKTYTDPMKWVPLRVTADLSNPGLPFAKFRNASDGQEFAYDPVKVRLFRWQQGKWVEYSDNTKALFTPVPGALLWIKTRESCIINFGGGITPSLRQPYPISLSPGDFTDFALPFKFEIKVGDIISQSGPGAENLEFYSWDRDPVSNRFTSMPLYIARLSAGSTSSVIGYADNTGYTVRCPAGAPATLSIPPIPKDASKYLPKRAAFNGWSVTVNASLSDGTRLCPIYCAFSAGQGSAPEYFPVPPSFLEAYAGVVDNTANKIHGHALAHALLGGGCSYQIAFVNTSELPQKLAYYLGNTASLPKGMTARVYNEATGAYENPSAGVSLAAGETQYRWLLVGSEVYLAKTAAVIKNGKLMFAGTYPNPSGALVHIRYSVPQAGVSRVKFAIYDMRGRLVWQRTTAEQGAQGLREIIWDGMSLNKRPVVAGIYIIRMEALDAKQRSAGVFEKKMTYMP
jgi:PKD repeat protein